MGNESYAVLENNSAISGYTESSQLHNILNKNYQLTQNNGKLDSSSMVSKIDELLSRVNSTSNKLPIKAF
jgi:hypothetical protein